jgi:H+/gluconate symporter-like permease
MSFLVAVAALALLMFVAYRGYSVILFAPVCALLAVLVTDPAAVPAVFSGVFMEKMVGFVKLYFPVFLLGAIFGKVVELSGFSKAIVAAVIGVVGRQRAMLSIVLVCAVLTYGGVSLFVVVFAVYPFAAEMFKASNIPKRLIPGTIALGAFTFTMDSLPGSPQIQNIIPTTFFKTTTWAAPWLGVVGSVFILIAGLSYLEWRRRAAAASNEGYGEGHTNEPAPVAAEALPNALIALLPLLVVGVANLLLVSAIPAFYGKTYEVQLAMAHPVVTQVSSLQAIWAVEGALLLGILTVLAFAFRPVATKFAEGSKAAVSGALLASLNTASEYGFGAVIAALPGFLVIQGALKAIPNPLVNEAISVTTLAGITGSASGGMSIALAAMADQFIAGAQAAGIPLEVLHRVASMASGGMDTLPHNGAVITLLTVTGLTHKTSYKDIFAVTCIKTMAVFVVIAAYYLFGIV